MATHPFDRDDAETFLRILFHGVPGLIEVRTFGAEGGAPERSFHRHIGGALATIESASGRERNVFVGVATRREHGSGGKDNLLYSRALFVDRDGLTDPAAHQQHETELKGFALAPSMRVNSGGGEHVYWLLREPFSLDTEERRQRFESVLRGLCDSLGGDRAATDSSRILRVPGTLNHPDERKRAKGRRTGPCSLESVDVSHVEAVIAEMERRDA